MIKTKAILIYSAVAASLSAMPLASLISGADAIVVGTESAPIQVGKAVSFHLQVERVFSGDVQPGAAINVVWNARTPVEVPEGSPSVRGIWFLHKAAGGDWECIPAGTSGNAEFFPEVSLPVSAGALPGQLAYDVGTTALADQIILEMAGGNSRPNARMILGLAAGMNSPGAFQAFRYLATSQSNDQMLVGLAGLIQAGDPNGLLSAETLSGRLTASSPGADLIASSIKLHFRSTDPSAVAALGRMATSSNASSLLQDASAAALAAIHSLSAVPWLGLLLTSSSNQQQIYGAQGLSYFVNGVGIATPQTMPTLDHLNKRQANPYRTHETDQHIGYPTGQPEPFIQYWQGWWEQHPELHAGATGR